MTRANLKSNEQCSTINRITIAPGQCGGRPCIRGMRIRVVNVLDLLANDLSAQPVREEFPDLGPDDIHACLAFGRAISTETV